MRRLNLPLFCLFLALVLAGATLRAGYAADITVNTINDVLDAAGSCAAVTPASLPGPDGVTSLREAMCAANQNPGADTIEFNISGCSGGCTIRPNIALPVLIKTLERIALSETEDEENKTIADAIQSLRIENAD